MYGNQVRQSSVPNTIFSPLSSLLSPHVAPTCGARHREIEGRREEKGEALPASSIFSIFLARPSENLNGQDLSLYHKGFRVFLGLSQQPIFLLLKNCRWAPLVADLGAHRPKNEPQEWATRLGPQTWPDDWATRLATGLATRCAAPSARKLRRKAAPGASQRCCPSAPPGAKKVETWRPETSPR